MRLNGKTLSYEAIFCDGVLEYSAFEGGYFDPEGGTMYYLTDWQGNNAAVVNNKGDIVQKTAYYPYGEPTVEPAGQRFLFGGKEREHAAGRNTYDFSARCLTPYGRWGVNDRKAEKNCNISPYAYCSGDPINFIDPDGELECALADNYNGNRLINRENFNAPRDGGKRLHKGIDMYYQGSPEVSRGAPIVATHDGIVIKIATYDNGDNNAGGNRITIRSSDGRIMTKYMHCLELDYKLKEGMFVKEGQVIAKVGGSGKGILTEYRDHLHYEMYVDGVVINPVDRNGKLIDPQKMLTIDNNNYRGNLDEFIITIQITPSPNLIPVTITPLPIKEVKRIIPINNETE